MMDRQENRGSEKIFSCEELERLTGKELYTGEHEDFRTAWLSLGEKLEAACAKSFEGKVHSTAPVSPLPGNKGTKPWCFVSWQSTCGVALAFLVIFCFSLWQPHNSTLPPTANRDVFDLEWDDLEEDLEILEEDMEEITEDLSPLDTEIALVYYSLDNFSEETESGLF